MSEDLPRIERRPRVHITEEALAADAPSPARFCRHCGSGLTVDAAFCTSCGTSVAPAAPAPPPSSGAKAREPVALTSAAWIAQAAPPPAPPTPTHAPPIVTGTREVALGRGGVGKIRSFWVGLLLTIVTLSIYAYCWYYFVNDELKDIGAANDDQNLATSSPAQSVLAILLGGWLVIPPLLSVYNYGNRIRRAQMLVNVPLGERINPTLAFLLLFPGAFLVVPVFVHYWYVTRHQNRTLRAA